MELLWFIMDIRLEKILFYLELKSSLRRILNKGLDNPGSLFGRELELFELMRKNQKLGIPNFAVDGPVII